MPNHRDENYCGLFPGLGQLLQGRKALGAIVISLSVICLITFFGQITEEVNEAAQRIAQGGSTDILRIQAESHEIVANLKTPIFLISFYGLVTLWAFSVLEIFFPIRKK